MISSGGDFALGILGGINDREGEPVVNIAFSSNEAPSIGRGHVEIKYSLNCSLGNNSLVARDLSSALVGLSSVVVIELVEFEVGRDESEGHLETGLDGAFHSIPLAISDLRIRDNDSVAPSGEADNGAFGTLLLID